jgi:hypothetical protein
MTSTALINVIITQPGTSPRSDPALSLEAWREALGHKGRAVSHTPILVIVVIGSFPSVSGDRSSF